MCVKTVRITVRPVGSMAESDKSRRVGTSDPRCGMRLACQIFAARRSDHRTAAANENTDSVNVILTSRPEEVHCGSLTVFCNGRCQECAPERERTFNFARPKPACYLGPAGLGLQECGRTLGELDIRSKRNGHGWI